MTGEQRPLAARMVTGVVAGMVAATAAATIVGFWLSYRGLHDFAGRAGLRGAEAWAWPASVDLFIAAGEAGVTISALRRHRDRAAWMYLAIGFAASVTGNVLHVDPAALFWTRYAVAAVPPVAAMLAMAALLRQAYRLATDPAAIPAGAPAAAAAVRARGPAPDRSGDRSQSPLPGRAGGHDRGRSAGRSRPALVTADDAEREFMPELLSGAVPSLRQIRSRMHVGAPRAHQLREHLASVTTRA